MLKKEVLEKTKFLVEEVMLKKEVSEKTKFLVEQIMLKKEVLEKTNCFTSEKPSCSVSVSQSKSCRRER